MERFFISQTVSIADTTSKEMRFSLPKNALLEFAIFTAGSSHSAVSDITQFVLSDVKHATMPNVATPGVFIADTKTITLAGGSGGVINKTREEYNLLERKVGKDGLVYAYIKNDLGDTYNFKVEIVYKVP